MDPHRVVALALLMLLSTTAVSARSPAGDFSRGCAAVPLSCAPGCAKAIEDALIACSTAGGGTVQLAPGTYHANDSSWVADGQAMVILKGLQNVRLQGQTGSGRIDTPQPDPTATTLLVYGLHGAFALSNCTNVQIVGIQVDMARQPYTYGQCTAADAGTFTVRFDAAAYPFSPALPWVLTDEGS